MDAGKADDFPRQHCRLPERIAAAAAVVTVIVVVAVGVVSIDALVPLVWQCHEHSESPVH